MAGILACREALLLAMVPALSKTETPHQPPTKPHSFGATTFRPRDSELQTKSK